MIKLILLALSGFMLALPVVVQAQFTFETNNNALTITGYTGAGGAVTIPGMIDGLPVTSIGNSAFQATSLSSVTILDGVTSIGIQAFAYCDNLVSATIPNTVTNIGAAAFHNCTNLAGIMVDNLNLDYSSLAGVLFNSLQTVLIQYPGGKLGAYSIPAGVTKIASGAFSGSQSLPTVMIPETVTTIGDWALSVCPSLTNITVAEPNPVFRSVAGVLFDEPQTVLIQYPAGRLGTYAIPAGVTNIGAGAFAYCSGLTSVDIPESVANIGSRAFYHCANLAFVTIPHGVTVIEVETFSLCTNLTSVVLPNSVTSIGDAAFASCISLMIATIPSSVINIGDWAFDACLSLTNVIIPNSVTNIGSWAFHSCSSLTSVVIPTSLTKIAEGTFDTCFSLTNLIIPTSITSIEDFAFLGCSGLTSVIIPSSVTNIGNYAFAWCIGLEGIYFQGNAPRSGSFVFHDFNPLTVYYLPGTKGWGTTFGDCPTALWFLPNPLILNDHGSFGVQSNVFGFTISWATNIPVVVEASASLIAPMWQPIKTNTLTSGTAYFTDSQWMSYPHRFYRLRAQ